MRLGKKLGFTALGATAVISAATWLGYQHIDGIQDNVRELSGMVVDMARESREMLTRHNVFRRDTTERILQLEWEVRDLNESMDEKRNTIEENLRLIDEYYDRMNMYQNRIYNTINGYHEQIYYFHVRIAELQEDNEMLRELLGAGDESLWALTAEISRLNNELSTANNEILRLEGELSQANSDMDELAMFIETELGMARNEFMRRATPDDINVTMPQLPAPGPGSEGELTYRRLTEILQTFGTWFSDASRSFFQTPSPSNFAINLWDVRGWYSGAIMELSLYAHANINPFDPPQQRNYFTTSLSSLLALQELTENALNEHLENMGYSERVSVAIRFSSDNRPSWEDEEGGIDHFEDGELRATVTINQDS